MWNNKNIYKTYLTIRLIRYNLLQGLIYVMPAIDVVVKPIKDTKSAEELQAILSKPSKKPVLSKEAEMIVKKMSFNLK